MDNLRDSASLVIDRPAAELYAMVADIGRMGEWSPVCIGAAWDDPDQGPVVGAEFTGYNRTPDRSWEVRARVTTAEPGRAFGWEIGEGWARWTYEFRPTGPGTSTEVVESWEFTPAGRAEFVRRYGDEADDRIELRRQQAHDGMPQTLAAIKSAAESAGGAQAAP